MAFYISLLAQLSKWVLGLVRLAEGAMFCAYLRVWSPTMIKGIEVSTLTNRSAVLLSLFPGPCTPTAQPLSPGHETRSHVKAASG